MESSNKIIDLRSLLQGDGKSIYVPANIAARLDVAGGPLIIAGSFINEGSVEIIGNEHASSLLQAKSFVNKGEIKSALKRVMIGAGSLENTGSIVGSKTLELIGIAGPLKVLGMGGSFAAQEAVIVNAKFGINVAGGNFSAPSIDFNADEGIAQISAEALNGKVNIKSKSQANNQARALPALLAGPHVYYNNGAGVSLGSDVSHGSDEVIIVSTHDITIDGSITCGKLTLAAGVLFKINGNYPPSGQVNDSNSSCLIESAQGAASITVNGDLNTSDDVLVKAWTFEVFADSVSIDGKLTTGANTRLDGTSSVHIEEEIQTLREANILLFSDGPVGTGAITIDNSTASIAGRLGVKAYRAGGSSEFIIGGTNNSNGINGSIVVDTVSGGGNDPSTYWYGGVYISNGGSGGIKVTAASNISVKGTQSKSGGIILDAHDGTIKLPAGTLSVDGTGNYPGAVIHLLAETINTENGTIISATDNGTGQTQKAVQIAAKTINLQGANGLTIKADGGGNQTYPDNVTIVPKGSIAVSDNDSVTFFSIFAWLSNGTFNNEGEVAFAGSGSAPLKLTSNGSHSRVELSGYPLKFAGGPVTVESKGAENHEINILYYGATSGANGLQFNGGDVTLDASGPASGNGDAGKITLGIDKTVRSALGKVVMRANGHGNGKGGQISFNPGAVDIKVGGSNEEYSFSAKGGDTDGDGGKIDIQGYSSSVSVKGATSTATVLDVSVPGSTGNGGEINIVAYGISGLSFDATAPSYLKADGGTSDGDGGKITILTTNVPLTIGGTNGSVALSAMAKGGDGAGGTLDVTSWAGITADTLDVDVTADGEGNGGTVKLNAGYSGFTLNGGEINTDGGSSGGSGGVIRLEAGEITLPALENTLLSANGKNTGNGGKIEVITHWASVNFGSGNEALNVEAKAGEGMSARIGFATGSSKGGELKIIQALSFNVDTTGIFVHSGDNGDGGEIRITCEETISCNSPLSAYGSGTGKGGTIDLQAKFVNFGLTASMDARGGEGGDGGTISILGAVEPISIANTIDASGRGSGKGGTITVETPLLKVNLGTPRLKANGGSDGGAGGTIQLKTNTGLLIDETNVDPYFQALGFDEADGGNVEVDVTNAKFSINKTILVNSGDNAGSAVYGGSITLNGVKVYRHVTSNTGVAKVLWTQNAVMSTDDTDVSAAAQTLPNSFKNAVTSWTLYRWATPQLFDLFAFDQASVDKPDALGLTVPENQICNVFMQTALGGLNPTLQATTVHELGHALAAQWNLVGLSTSFGTALNALIADLNAADPVCASHFISSNICTLYPNDANFTRFTKVATAGQSNAFEIFAYLFEAKACVTASLSGNPNRVITYTRWAQLTTYFNNLWLL